MPFYAIWQKIGMSCKLSGKTKFSMATCRLYMSWPLFTAKFHIFTFTTNLNLFLALSVNFRIFWWFYVSLYQILALDLDDTRNIIGHAKLFFRRYCFYYLFITTVNSSLTRNIFYVARELFFLIPERVKVPQGLSHCFLGSLSHTLFSTVSWMFSHT